MTDDLETLKLEIRQFVRERDWEQFHDAKNLAMCLAAEVGELVAELRWVPTDGIASAVSDPATRTRLQNELGDVMISLQMLADSLEMDLIGAARAKVLANASKYPVDLVRGKADLS